MEYNAALTTNFKAEIAGAEEFNFFIQNISLPSVQLSEVPANYRNEMGYVPGETLEYDPLVFSFLVAEDLSNYFYILEWIKKFQNVESPMELFKDVTLHVLNNNKLENIKFKFVNVFPTMLGNLDFESNTVQPSPLISQVTMRYLYFTHETK